MTSIADRLLAQSVLRVVTRSTGGETVWMREPTAWDQVQYRTLLEEKGEEHALGYLVHRCTFSDEGCTTRTFTAEQGQAMALGNPALFAPLMNGVLEVATALEKKASMPSGDSPTDSPSPSADAPATS